MTNFITLGIYGLQIQAKVSDPHPTTKICEVTVKDTPKSTKKMSALIFDDEAAYRAYLLQMGNVKHGFHPNMELRYGEGRVIALKDYIGCQIIAPTRNIWVCNQKNKPIRSNSWYTDEIRKILWVMYRKHNNNERMGFMREHTYMEKSTGTTTFTMIREEQHDLCTEIYQDLLEVKKLMKDLQNATIAFNDDLPSDLDFFFRLYPVDAPKDVEEAKIFSYIVCHAPLFMGYVERNEFACTYHDIIEGDKVSFDGDVKYRGTQASVGKWWEKLPKDPKNRWRLLYNNCERHTEEGLIPFIRRSYSHMTAEEFSTDYMKMEEGVLFLFPNAFLKAYYAVFKKRQLGVGFALPTKFVGKFRKGVTPLDYSIGS